MSETLNFNDRNLTNIGDVTAATVSATTLTGAGSGITDLNMANAASGTLAVTRGGTGVTTSTGTGSVVLSAGPTFTGTVTAATVTSIATPVAAANVLTVRGSSTTGNVVQFSNTAGGTFIMTNTGNVGIGSTNPGSALVVSTTGYTAIVSETTGLSGSTGGPSFLLRAIGSPYTNSYVQLYAEYNAAGIAKGFFQVWNGASTFGQLNTTTAINQFWLNGYTTAGTLSVSSAGQVTSSSDARIKSNISTLADNFTSNIMNLRPVYYTLNSDPEKVKIGFIAQDVENVIPEAVDGKKYEYTWKLKKVDENGGATVPDLDENGNLQFTDEIRPRGLDDRAIIACLVKAFQEQVVRSDSLETQLQTAQNDINLLESRLAAIEARSPP